MKDLLTRDGHLSDLSLERILGGEIPPDVADGHLADCPECQRRLAALRAHQATYLSPPLRLPRPQPRGPWLIPAIVAAAAVVFYLSLGQQPLSEINEGGLVPSYPEDTYRIKGGLNVEFFVKRGSSVQKLKDGDVVHPGDRLGFRTATVSDGHLMIVGVDGQREPYLCFPQQNGGRSSPVQSNRSMVTLDEAVVFDDVLGREDIVAIFCENGFQFTELRDALKAGARPSSALMKVGCRQRAIHLLKRRLEP
ncbi:MAG: hypothetical protein VX589_10440 [Myxococcota bacterium]|nr:hypothetical protein [Myxococcota bacterium]